MKQLLLGLSLILCASQTFSQKAPAKFGDVSIEDVKMSTYAKDTAAAAVVLVDYGSSSLDYNEDKGFFITFERLTRIKILKKDGFKYGDFIISLYRKGSQDEKVTSIKATTYNLENNSIVETKLKNDAVFKEEVNDNLIRKKFSMPNLKEGSVIEVFYRVNSEFYWQFQDWTFQAAIPTVWSEYRASVPEYFHYDRVMQGYVPLVVNEEKSGAGQNGFTEVKNRWAAQDVPAFREEPYLTTPDDYISKINFELAYTKFPNEPIKHYTTTWEDINKMYWESSSFGGELAGNGFLKKIAEQVIQGKTTPEEKISALSNYVKSNVKWDERYREGTSNGLKKVLDEKKGTSGEINLLLASLLEKVGFSVYPVLISTRDNGFVRQDQAMSSQFNYSIVLVQYDDKQVLLDATEPFLPTGVLPERCLNGHGLVITQAAPTWINIPASQKTKSIASFNLTLNPEGLLSGNFTYEHTGYEALSARKNYTAKGEETYVKDFLKSRDWEFSKSEFEAVKDIDKAFKAKHDLQIQNHITSTGDVMYVNPFLLMQIQSNPFTLEKREYPVDFGYAYDDIYMVQITIPDGYVVEELPKSRVLALPANASRYVYNMAVNGNKITFTSSFSINKSLFIMDEYPNLREFYTKVAAAQAEQIVLKKKI